MTIEEYNSINQQRRLGRSTNTVIPALWAANVCQLRQVDLSAFATTGAHNNVHARNRDACYNEDSNKVAHDYLGWGCSTTSSSNRQPGDQHVQQGLHVSTATDREWMQPSFHNVWAGIPTDLGDQCRWRATPCFNRSATISSGTRTGCGPTTSRFKCPTWTWNQHNRRRGSYSNAWSMVEHRCSIISQHPPGMLWWRCCNRCTAPASPAASTQATSCSRSQNRWEDQRQQPPGTWVEQQWTEEMINNHFKEINVWRLNNLPLTCPRMRSNSCCVRIAQQRWWSTDGRMRSHPTGETGTSTSSLWIFSRSLRNKRFKRESPGMRKIRWVLINICGWATDVKLQAISPVQRSTPNPNSINIMWLRFNNVCFVQCVGSSNKLRGRVSNNIVQHTIRVQFSCWMSLSTLWINRPWAWSYSETVCQQYKRVSAHSISCNIDTTELPESFQLYIYMITYA